jgi:hypothetical protein
MFCSTGLVFIIALVFVHHGKFFSPSIMKVSFAGYSNLVGSYILSGLEIRHSIPSLPLKFL